MPSLLNRSQDSNVMSSGNASFISVSAWGLPGAFLKCNIIKDAYCCALIFPILSLFSVLLLKIAKHLSISGFKEFLFSLTNLAHSTVTNLYVTDPGKTLGWFEANVVCANTVLIPFLFINGKTILQ